MAELPAVPYRGIQPFRYVDHAIFFAREDETRELASLVAVYRGVMLYGDSGTGKSSLINAGLLPEVAALGLRAERVRVQPRAGEEIVLDDGDAPRAVLSTQTFEERVREASAAQRPLIIFDQFEELVTLFDGPEALQAQQRVVALLVRLLREPLRVKVLIAFREDYLGRVKQLLAACPELVDQALRLGPPAASALPTIIRGPFERYPGHFARELSPQVSEQLQRALQDGFASGDLGLSEVQTVCLRLWQSGDPQALLAARGPRGLLEDELGEALDSFPPDVRAAAIALLAQMVTSAGTRNVVSADDLLHRVGEEEEFPPRVVAHALERLERDSKLVRRERRRDITFYEITSEFLVPWISRRREDARRARARRRELRRTAIGFAVVAVFAAIAVWALAQRSDAQHQAKLSRSLALMATSATQLPNRPDVGLLFALDAYRTSPTGGTPTAVRNALVAAQGWGVLGILHGHDAGVFGVSIAPDGRTLASASADGTIRLWDVRSHRQLGDPLRGHTDTVYAVAYSPDGRMLASASADRSIRLWDVARRRQLGAPLTGHGGPIYAVAFSPDGRTLASASRDGTVREWDVASHRQLGEPLRGHRGAVFSVAFSPDGRTLASSSADTTVRLWDARSHRPLGKPLRGHTGTVASVAFSPDGRTLASASFDRTVRLWEVRTRRALRSPLRHYASVYAVAFSRDGRTLASSSADGTVRLFDGRGFRLLGTLTGHTGTVYCLAWGPDGRLLASGSDDGTIRLVDPVTQRGLLAGNAGPIYGVTFGAGGRVLASGGSDGTVRLWDARSHATLGAPLVAPRGLVLAVAIAPDGATLAAARGDGTITLWDVRTRRQVGRLSGHAGSVFAVAFSPDGRTLASGGADRTVRLWDVAARRQLGPALTGHGEPVYSVAFSPDGHVLASGGNDNLIRLWDARTRRPLGVLTGHKDLVSGLAFSPDGRTLASAGFDATVRLWDVGARRALGEPLRGHRGAVTAVAFSADGATLASAGADATVRLWQVPGGAPLGTLAGHAGRVSSVAFSPSGTLASGGNDELVRLWEGMLWRDYAQLRARVCGLLGTGLSRREWDRFAGGISYRASC